MPAFNRAATLPATLDSLLAQTYERWEAIVVDDGSEDETAAVAQGYADRDPRIRVQRQANAGVSGARNAGIAHARGRWLFFLDADDWIVPTAFAALIAAADADPAADAVYGGYVQVAEDGREVVRELPAHEPDFFPLFARTCAISIHSCLVRTELVRRVGGFDATLVTCEDWDLWQRVARVGARFAPIPDYIARYRMRVGSASRSGRRMLEDGLLVIERGHGDDPRMASAANGRLPLPRAARDVARTYFACYTAGLEIAAGHDACALLDELGDELSGDLDPHGVAETLVYAISLGCSVHPSDWMRLPPDVHASCDRFIDVLGERVGNHWLAYGARSVLERLVLEAAEGPRPRRAGRWQLIELDLAGEPPQDLSLDPDITRLLCAIRYGERRLGELEIPLVDGWMPARVLADAIVATLAWDVLQAHFEAHAYERLEVTAAAGRARVERDGRVLFDGPLDPQRTRAQGVHDAIGWAVLVRELWGVDASLEDVYADEREDPPDVPVCDAGAPLALDLAEPVPRVVDAGEEPLDVAVTVGGVPLTIARCEPRDGVVSAHRLRRALLLQSGFELCRAIVREGVVLAPADAGGTLGERLAAVRAARAGADARALLGDGVTAIGRAAGADGTSASRWYVLPAAAGAQRLELAR
ncbi:MAG TPA: glycosyltransferase, partial [Conexibacter sp.]|nr:glycosyltransferase [Conexibacter sp.]